MYRFVLLLVLWPVCTQAATPFISLGLAPLVTVFEYPGESEPAPYEENFVAVGGAATIGLSARQHEWYARFTWSNSRASTQRYESSTYIEDVAWSFHKFTKTDRWQDQRIALGYRWLPVRTEQKLIVGFVGAAASVGTSLWRQEELQTTETILAENYEREQDTIYVQTAKYSKYSWGGSAEIGGRVSLKRALYIEISARIGAYRGTFRDEQVDFEWRNYKAGTAIEPSLLLALHWEMR